MFVYDDVCVYCSVAVGNFFLLQNFYLILFVKFSFLKNSLYNKNCIVYIYFLMNSKNSLVYCKISSHNIELYLVTKSNFDWNMQLVLE